MMSIIDVALTELPAFAAGRPSTITLPATQKASSQT